MKTMLKIILAFSVVIILSIYGYAQTDVCVEMTAPIRHDIKLLDDEIVTAQTDKIRKHFEKRQKEEKARLIKYEAIYCGIKRSEKWYAKAFKTGENILTNALATYLIGRILK